ncbi:SET domain protein [Aspergillus sclerotiicarbonarius CBS 121057]|uniref:SET domain protein n=1 Tax=Aspergillus sclerotiicarbonarius (strain CBS 121057 / IBT 28362) TaxID=1448318 RepID=A0A319EWM9_ASPSB|nr:SET domain protein [Aspergillus sclerotiicarbonarius CBS 121057]
MASAMPGLSMSSDDDSLQIYFELLHWMVSNGGNLHESVQIAKDESRGVHLQVKKDWKDGVPNDTHIIKTPLSTTMSYFNVIDHSSTAEDSGASVAFPAHGLHLPQAFVDAVGPKESTIFFLIGQYLRVTEGFWYPYIRTLPQPGSLTTPPYYEGDDLVWLNGTSLLPAREQRMSLLKEKYEKGSVELRQAGFQGAEEYTWDLYLWAASMFISRAFSAKVMSGVFPDKELSEEHFSVLLPLIDMGNHRPLAKVEWRAGKDNVAFVVLEDVTAGQEISNNYGPRNNEQLMMNYGFCIPGNPCDHRIVSLRAPPGSPLQVAKSHQVQMHPELGGETEDHYYVFNVFYPLLAPHMSMEHSIFSPALLDAVSVLAANNRELETLEITSQAIKIPSGYGNSRALLAALSQVIIELITHAAKLRASGEDLQTPTNLKQTHAKVYRDSQIMLSETALVIAAWTLNRARQHNFTGSWEQTKRLLGAHMGQIPAGKFPDEVFSRLQVRILERQSLLKNNGELFTLSELPDLLPVEMHQPCKACFQDILSVSENAIPMLNGIGGSSPFAFPMFLCLVVAVHTASQSAASEGVQLPSRLSRWASFLLENYPPPPNDVAWAVEDEDDEHMLGLFDDVLEKMRTQNAGVFAKLARYTGDWQKDDWWLSPNWLRWGWMIGEQECVQIPEDPLRLLATGGGGQVRLATGTYLYVPGEEY